MYLLNGAVLVQFQLKIDWNHEIIPGSNIPHPHGMIPEVGLQIPSFLSIITSWFGATKFGGVTSKFVLTTLLLFIISHTSLVPYNCPVFVNWPVPFLLKFKKILPVVPGVIFVLNIHFKLFGPVEKSVTLIILESFLDKKFRFGVKRSSRMNPDNKLPLLAQSILKSTQVFVSLIIVFWIVVP